MSEIPLYAPPPRLPFLPRRSNSLHRIAILCSSAYVIRGRLGIGIGLEASAARFGKSLRSSYTGLYPQSFDTLNINLRNNV